MTTISEFIDSTALEETVVKNCPKYREKFLNIVEKAGVGDSNTKDKEAIKKIIGTRSWNWAAFLFNTHWAIYRKENILGWGLFTVCWLVTVIALWVPSLETVDWILTLFALVFVGIYGSSYVLRNCIQTVENTTSPLDRAQRSPVGLTVAIVIDIVILGIIGVSFFEELV